MTCIVGIVDGEKVFIGGDSAAVGDQTVTIRKDPKVFTVGEFLFGCTSSFRMIQLIQFSFTPPKRHQDTDVFEYMCTAFIDAIRSCFKAGGFAALDSSVESGGCFLVGYQGRLFRIDSDFQVGESDDLFAAIGCGESFAKGALRVLGTTLPASGRIERALEAAAHFSTGVRRPFIIREV